MPEMVLGYPFMVSQAILSALEQRWLQKANAVSRARFARAVGKIGLLRKTSPFDPIDAVPFHVHSHRE